MPKFIVLFLGVCILPIVSMSHVTAETLVPEVHAASNESNVNFTSAPIRTSSSNDSSKCDYTSYPDFCIAAPPPSLNCDDVGNDFKVFPPDPHGFDRDHDGEGCETSE